MQSCSRFNFVLQKGNNNNAIIHACVINDNFSFSYEPIENAFNVPIGSVEFCMNMLKDKNISSPKPIDYPEQLLKFTKREIRLCAYKEIPKDVFVKPFNTKQNQEDFTDDTLVWVSPFLDNLLAEWRVYVLHNEIIGYARYDGNNNDLVLSHEQIQELNHWIKNEWTGKDKPIGFALDVAQNKDNELILIEVNDGWALGYYKGTCSVTDYAKLLIARWQAVTTNKEN
jgi:hypothetical protein